MTAEELAFAGPRRHAQLVREGQISSRELVTLYLERIERMDPQLNAFRVVLGERALAEADQADARRKAGDDRPLLGVPLAIKDDQDVAGEVTARGSSAHGPPAAEDSEIVRRLRSAGAVVLGKTNVPELEIMGATESEAFGVTRNPWKLDRTSGGSSGGSAAAVAAGLVSAASGSDGAGSIRIPASCCGIFGLKPQRGRITLSPRREVWHGMDVYGFLTRSTHDSALLLDVAAGAVPEDPDPVPPPERPFAEACATPPGVLRVALSAKPALTAPKASPEVRRPLEQMGELLRSLGHTVERRDPDYGQTGNSAVVRYLRGISDDARAMPHPERLERRTKGFARMGGALPDRVLTWARRSERPHSQRINRIFDEVDVLMTPVMRIPPVSADQWRGKSGLRTFMGLANAYPYAAIWNMTGQPAAAVPAGFTEDGVPLSVQLVGRPGDEATLLALAAQIEAERPWTESHPPVA
jgi:amidase